MVVCRSAKEFVAAVRTLFQEEGPCLLDECSKTRQLGFRRGPRLVRLPLDVYYDQRGRIEARFGPLKSLVRYRLKVAEMIEHGHLPPDRESCPECVARDPALAKRLAAAVLDV